MRPNAWVMALCLAVAAAGARAADDPLCDPLRRVVSAAAAGNRLAEITGIDAGLYHETSVKLPGAKLCTSSPDETPPAWRCLMHSESKYTLALDAQAKLSGRVAACLGPEWSRADVDRERYLAGVEFTRPDSPVRVQVKTTKKARRLRSWAEHRLIVAVFP